MTPVGLEGLTRLLRSQLSAVRAARPIHSQAAASTNAAGQTNASGAALRRNSTSAPRRTSGRDDLATRLARRMLDVDPVSPMASQQALTVFLECLLLQEWGDDLANDPEFHGLVDTVQAQMRAEPSLGPVIAQATQQLLDAARAARPSKT